MQIPMTYIIKRIFIAAITTWLLVTITLVLMHMMPGEPFLYSLLQMRMPMFVLTAVFYE